MGFLWATASSLQATRPLRDHCSTSMGYLCPICGQNPPYVLHFSFFHFIYKEPLIVMMKGSENGGYLLSHKRSTIGDASGKPTPSYKEILRSKDKAVREANTLLKGKRKNPSVVWKNCRNEGLKSKRMCKNAEKLRKF